MNLIDENVPNLINLYRTGREDLLISALTQRDPNIREGKVDVTEFKNLIEFIKKIDYTKRSNTLVLQLSLRKYYHTIQWTGQPKEELNISGNLVLNSSALYAEVFTNTNPSEQLKKVERLKEIFKNSIRNNDLLSLQNSLKILNLGYKKFENDILKQIDWITLDEVYFCLQTTECRDETTQMFKNYILNLKISENVTENVFENWSWYNKNKYLILSVLIERMYFSKTIQNLVKNKVFQLALKKALLRKELFSASQLVIRALDQYFPDILKSLVLDILENGSEIEISNFKTQWFSILSDPKDIVESISFEQSCGFRFLNKLDMFSIYLKNNDDFNNHSIFEYLEENFGNFSDANILVLYKYLSKSLEILNLEKALDLIFKILKVKISIPSAEFRNNILSKFEEILHTLGKLGAIFEIEHFFRLFLNFLFENLHSKEYQPLIFSIKTLEILFKVYFPKTNRGTSKKSNVSKNAKFGQYLIKSDILEISKLSSILITIYPKVAEYDDVRNSITNILLNLENAPALVDVFQKLVFSKEINKVAISSSLAKIICATNMWPFHDLHKFCKNEIDIRLENFKTDPFAQVSNTGHLFGFLYTINEIVLTNSLTSMELYNLVQLTESLGNSILNMMSCAEEDLCAASFEVIDQSLLKLISNSSYKSEQLQDVDRKNLLLSFWLTIRACCDLAATIGCILSAASDHIVEDLENLERCLNLISSVLHLCRHKGAIEAAGLSLGILVAKITKDHTEYSKTYSKLTNCFEILFGNVRNISTTRRGAGLTIMFHNLLKNEKRKSRPLFQNAISILLSSVKQQNLVKQNRDSIESLALHYLCCLVKDTTLRIEIEPYYDDIMVAALQKINSHEWTVRNAALQLFGGILPKVVGQIIGHQSEEESEGNDEWESNDITYFEINYKYPKTCKYILEYCNLQSQSPATIILILQFLSNIEYFSECKNVIENFRTIFWKFLSHKVENIRKLAAICFIRSLKIQIELPLFLKTVAEDLLQIKNDNFLQSNIFLLIEGIKRYNCEFYLQNSVENNNFLVEIRKSFCRNECEFYKFSFYIQIYIVKLFKLLNIQYQGDVQQNLKSFGYEAFCEIIKIK